LFYNYGKKSGFYYGILLDFEGVGDFYDDHDWGSSEPDADDAWNQGFGNGGQNYYYKYFNARVRAVRAF